jgi:anti-anti-sigma factor
MQLRERSVEGAMVIDLSGDGIGSEPSILKALVTSLLERGHRHIVFNAEHLQNMDSTCLAEIVASYKATMAEGGLLKMASATPPVRRVMHVTKVDTFVVIYDSEAEAIASFDHSQRRA